MKDLQKQLAEERAREEMDTLAEAAGVKRRSEKLDWMYQGGVGARQEADQRTATTMQEMATRGGAIDAKEVSAPIQVEPAVDDRIKQGAPSQLQASATLPKFYSEDTPASANEMWQRLHADPLFAIKQQELAVRQEIISNPRKLQAIKEHMKNVNKNDSQTKTYSEIDNRKRSRSRSPMGKAQNHSDRHRSRKDRDEERRRRKKEHQREKRSRDRKHRTRYSKSPSSDFETRPPRSRSRSNSKDRRRKKKGYEDTTSRKSSRGNDRKYERSSRDADDRRSHKYYRDKNGTRSVSPRFEDRRRSYDNNRTEQDGHRKESHYGRETMRDSDNSPSRHSGEDKHHYSRRSGDFVSETGDQVKYGMSYSRNAPDELIDRDRKKRAEATKRMLEEAARRHREEEQEEKRRIAKAREQRNHRKPYRPGSMTEEERQKRLEEMTIAAKDHESARHERIREQTARENEEEKEHRERASSANLDKNDSSFLQKATQEIYGASKSSGGANPMLSDSVGRRKAFVQRDSSGAGFTKQR